MGLSSNREDSLYKLFRDPEVVDTSCMQKHSWLDADCQLECLPIFHPCCYHRSTGAIFFMSFMGYPYLRHRRCIGFLKRNCAGLCPTKKTFSPYSPLNSRALQACVFEPAGSSITPKPPLSKPKHIAKRVAKLILPMAHSGLLGPIYWGLLGTIGAY